MTANRTKTEVLDRDFLEVRCKILEVAASLDRLDRAAVTPQDHPDSRLALLRQGIEALIEPGPGRAETIQRLFSLEYHADWRQRFGLESTDNVK